MRSFGRLFGVWVAAMLPAAAIGVVSSPAVAQVSAADKAAAQVLFDDAKRLFLAKKFADACPRFEKSQRLDPGIGTLLYLADCYEGMGLVASAWVTFREAAGAAKLAGQGEREQVARGRAAILEPKLYRLLLKVRQSDQPGLLVKRNAADVPKDVWNLPFPIDPGKYTIEATAPGKQPWSGTIEIPQGPGDQTITVPPLEDVTSKPAPRAALQPPPPVAPQTGGKAQQIAGVVVGVAGLGGIVVGSIFGVQAQAKATDSTALCRGVRCINAAGVDTIRQARRDADIATGAFIGGGAALALGVTLFVTAPREPSEVPPERSSASSRAPSGVWVGPAVGAGAVGIVGGGSW
jgi:hypothetical protein